MNDMLNRGRPAEILLVEDNDNDVELTKIGFQRTRLAVNLHHVPDGEECMAFLRRQGQYAEVPTPDLILLDLNMPRMNGREVLQAISEDPELRHLPVVVLTTSDAEKDVLTSYRLRCSSYIVKPVDFENFAKVVQSLTDYWFTLVVLPPGKGQ
ncbi:response regulator [Gallaecimonas kandeliae]|uniref:response regulator n=1 Tax=Gallaecimonas kandeliae TaxID=3029055 RepID=UPI002649A999|nr:response regulator [Gallaecimonas kandeliae]WKE64731.1 response regulator [Gallaecimonas kandeliae]